MDAHIAAQADWSAWRSRDGALIFRPRVLFDLYTGTGPNTAKIGLAGEYRWQGGTLEVDTGLESHFLLPDELRPLMGNGFFATAAINLITFYGLSFGFGFGVFPIGDVDDDPAFIAKDYAFQTQFLYRVSFDGYDSNYWRRLMP